LVLSHPLEFLFESSQTQISTQRAFGIDLTADDGFFSIFFEGIKRKIEPKMCSRARIFEAVGLAPGRAINTLTWVGPEIVFVLAPKVVDGNLCQFRHSPDIA